VSHSVSCGPRFPEPSLARTRRRRACLLVGVVYFGTWAATKLWWHGGGHCSWSLAVPYNSAVLTLRGATQLAGCHDRGVPMWHVKITPPE
jgi:hypothetical protein